MEITRKNNRSPLYCSFCGKSDQEVGYLVSGPASIICNECVELCREVGQNVQTTPPDAKLEPPGQDAEIKRLKRRVVTLEGILLGEMNVPIPETE